MKKLLVTLSAIAVTMLAFTATSDAGHTVRYIKGYDACGRPVFSYRYVPTYSYSYSRGYCAPSYRSSRSYGYSSRHYISRHRRHSHCR